MTFEERLEVLNWQFRRKFGWPILRFRRALALLIYPGCVTGYMCKTDAECELGGAMGGNTVYPSLEDLTRSAPTCVKSCGVREVHVFLGKTLVEENYEYNLTDEDMESLGFDARST